MDPDELVFVVAFFVVVMGVLGLVAAIYGIVDWLRGGVRGRVERAGWEYDEGATTLSKLGCAELPQFYIYRRGCSSLARGVVGGLEEVRISAEPVLEYRDRGRVDCFRLPGRSLPRFLIYRRPIQRPPGPELGRVGVEWWIERAPSWVDEVRRVELKDNPGFCHFFDVLLFHSRPSRPGDTYSCETPEKDRTKEQLKEEGDAQEAVLRRVLNREVQDFFMLRRDAPWHFEGGGEWVGIVLDPTLANQPYVSFLYVEEARTLLYQHLVRATAG